MVGNNHEFLQQLYASGAGGSFDAVGVHTDTACLLTSPAEYYREPNGRVGRYSFTGYREVHDEGVPARAAIGPPRPRGVPAAPCRLPTATPCATATTASPSRSPAARWRSTRSSSRAEPRRANTLHA